MAEKRLDTVVQYKRGDGKWAWRRINGYSGDITSTDGGQGYTNFADMHVVIQNMFGESVIYVKEDEHE